MEKFSCREFYVLSSLGFGNTSFNFKASSKSKTYRYRGQVEVDSVIICGDQLFVVEAKSSSRRTFPSIFKFKIGFSAKAVAEAVGREVYPILALQKKTSRFEYVVLFLDRVKPFETCIFDRMSVEKIYAYTINT
ncbi:MAG: hypothetical protein B6U89_06070 [Desulfurococcales archaeon ex4484_58]|nr:MAG: hypothetical protein B6U89_06070 [Desulfurococcales archaeon ex4484_58]